MGDPAAEISTAVSRSRFASLLDAVKAIVGGG
jgi:hypothetical protein